MLFLSFQSKQLELTEKEIAYFEKLMIQIETATLKDAYEIKEELELAGYLRKRQIKKRKTLYCSAFSEFTNSSFNFSSFFTFLSYS